MTDQSTATGRTSESVKQYADDTTLYHASGTAQEMASVLEDDLSILAHWVRNNGLKLNVNKTQVIMLSRKGRVKELESIKVTLLGVEIL